MPVLPCVAVCAKDLMFPPLHAVVQCAFAMATSAGMTCLSVPGMRQATTAALLWKCTRCLAPKVVLCRGS